MTAINRKELLGLSAGLAASVAAPAKAVPAPRAATPRPILFRRADILTMDPAVGELRGADLLAVGGRIAAVGPNLAAPGDAEIVDAGGMILTPGLIDNHRHVWESLECGAMVKLDPRSMVDYQPYKSQAMVCMTADDFYLAEYLGGLAALNTGVTTVVDYAHVHYTRDKTIAAVRGLTDSGVGGVFCYQLGHNPTHRKGEVLTRERATAERVSPPTEENWRVAEHVRDILFPSDGLLKFGLATSYGLGVRSMAETKTEFDRARALEPHLFATHIHKQKPLPEGVFRGVADLGRAGLLGPDFHVTHGVEMTDEELAMLRDAGSKVCSTVLGEFPYPKASIAPKARAMGIDCGIGQDASIGLSSDFFEVIRAAFWNMFREPEYARLAEGYNSTMILDYVTGLGARAARLDGDRGVLRPGLWADLVLIRTDRMGFAPFGSLADRVANFANTADVDGVWVRGQARKRNGRLVGVDWPKLRARAVDAGLRIQRDIATITLA